MLNTRTIYPISSSDKMGRRYFGSTWALPQLTTGKPSLDFSYGSQDDDNRPTGSGGPPAGLG
jgi:hypothetical protein